MEKTITLKIDLNYANGKGDKQFLETQSGNILKGLINKLVSTDMVKIYNIKIDNIQVV